MPVGTSTTYAPKLLVRARSTSPASLRNVTAAPRETFARFPEYATPRTSAAAEKTAVNGIVEPRDTSTVARAANRSVPR